MSTATDLSDSEMDLSITDSTTGSAASEPHISALAVPMAKLDQINNWTAQEELPFDPVAERLLEIEAHDEQGELQRGTLSVVFARPLLIEGKGWACLYRLNAMGRLHTSPARGVDAVDALQQAFTMVHRQLEGMRRIHRITREGGEDLGFASPDTAQGSKGQGCPVMSGSLSV